MKFGLVLPNLAPYAAPYVMLRAARLAVRLGFGSLWVSDHLLVKRSQARSLARVFEPLVTLAWIGAQVPEIALGTSVLILPLRDPILAAKQVATLDVLLEGRLVLGVGAGWNVAEFEFAGAPYGERGARLDEGLQAMRALWSSPTPAFQGRWWSLAGHFEPQPAQEGGPPYWIGGNSPAALRRARRLGQVWHPTGLSAPEILEGAERLGREMPIATRTTLRWDGGRAEEPPAVRSQLTGPPGEMRETLEVLQAAGVSTMVLGPLSSPERLEERLTRFRDEVAAELSL